MGRPRTSLSGSASGVVVETASYGLSDLEAGDDELRIDLSNANRADIFFRDISFLGSARPQWQLSTDGGSTVISGTSYALYFRLKTGESFYSEGGSVLVGASAETGSFSGVLSLSNMASAVPKMYRQHSENAGDPRDHEGWVDTSLAVNALVLTPNAATTFDAVDIDVVIYR